jgi:hypothetical protein
VKAYFWRIFVGLTQLLNTVLGGWPDESVSSRVWRLEQQGNAAARWARRSVDAAFFWQTEHCATAYQLERSRYRLPPIFRQPTED